MIRIQDKGQESKELSRILVTIGSSKESIRAVDSAPSTAVRIKGELILLYMFYSQLIHASTSYWSKVEDSNSLGTILRSAERDA